MEKVNRTIWGVLLLYVLAVPAFAAQQGSKAMIEEEKGMMKEGKMTEGEKGMLKEKKAAIKKKSETKKEPGMMKGEEGMIEKKADMMTKEKGMMK